MRTFIALPFIAAVLVLGAATYACLLGGVALVAPKNGLRRE